MDLRKVKKLIELVQESGIAELEVSSGDESVRIALHGSVAQRVSAPVAGSPVLEAAPHATHPTTHSKRSAQPSGHTIKAPMAGTFYRAPSPEAEAFIEVGTNVAEGDVVCIIESMKMMHEIKAAEAGVVAEICVANGTPIGTSADLFVLS